MVLPPSSPELCMRFGPQSRRKHKRHDCGLGGVLRWRDRLSVDFERRSQGRVSKQFLHNLELSAHASQKCRVRMSEGVSAEPLLDSEFECPWPDVLSQDCLSPVRLTTTTAAACKNPVVEFAVTLMSPPFLQGFDYDRMNWNGLLR